MTRRKRTRGSSSLELAFILPLIFSLWFGALFAGCLTLRLMLVHARLGAATRYLALGDIQDSSRLGIARCLVSLGTPDCSDGGSVPGIGPSTIGLCFTDACVAGSLIPLFGLSTSVPIADIALVPLSVPSPTVTAALPLGGT